MRRTYKRVHIRRGDFDNTPFLEVLPVTIRELEDRANDPKNGHISWINSDYNREAIERLKEAKPGDYEHIFMDVVFCTAVVDDPPIVAVNALTGEPIDPYTPPLTEEQVRTVEAAFRWAEDRRRDE